MKLETVIAEFLAPYPDTQQFRAIAHELWREAEGGWSSNDRFTIARGDKQEMLRACRGRWEVFKLNYSPRARVKDLCDIGWDVNHGISLECDFLPFIDIEPLNE